MRAVSKIYLFIIYSFLLFGSLACTSTEDPVDTSLKTEGTLNVAATLSSYNGDYAPTHVLAIWIENKDGMFIKSLLVNAAERKQYLTNWNSSSLGNSTDAITGATLMNYTSRTCTWNGKDKMGATVADGMYKVFVEFTENNATGKITSFSFTKSTAVDKQTPAAKNGIQLTNLTWTPK